MKHIQPFNKKTKTIVIIGLPGSGKSTLAEKISKHYKIYDDFMIYEAMKDIGKTNMIISDGGLIEKPNTFINRIKSICEEKDSDLKIIWFENNPEQCKNNIRKRWDNMDEISRKKNPHKDPKILEKEIDWYSTKYNPPSDTIPVYKSV